MPTTDTPPNFAVPERSESPSTVAAIGRPRVPYAETGVTYTRTASQQGQQRLERFILQRLMPNSIS